MTNLKVLSVAAALALVLPIATSGTSYAQMGSKFGGGGFRGGPVGGGGFRGGPVGGGFRAGPVGGAPVARFAGPPAGGRFIAPPVAGVRGPAFAGGGWAGGPRHYRRGGGFVPGLVAGAVIGGAIANSYAYGPNYYYAPGYYDDSYYYDDSAPAVAAAPGGDDVAYCMQTYRSYDPASGTYLGYDGQRHPCP